MVEYLKTEIVETKRTTVPNYGTTRDSYSCKSGAPSSLMIKLKGENIWRRVMIWQFSNAGTAFVRINNKEYIVLAVPEFTH